MLVVTHRSHRLCESQAPVCSHTGTTGPVLEPTARVTENKILSGCVKSLTG